MTDKTCRVCGGKGWILNGSALTTHTIPCPACAPLPSPDPARGEDGEAVRAQAGMRAPASPGSGDGEIGGLLDRFRDAVRRNGRGMTIEGNAEINAARRAVEEYVRGVERERDALLGKVTWAGSGDLSALLDALVEEVTDDVRAYGHVAEPEVARPRVEEYVAWLREERDRLAERVHKAEGMANEINILTAEVKSATRERDEARAEVERLRPVVERLVRACDLRPTLKTIRVDKGSQLMRAARAALAASTPAPASGIRGVLVTEGPLPSEWPEGTAMRVTVEEPASPGPSVGAPGGPGDGGEEVDRAP